MRYTGGNAACDDIPLLSQWIKKSRSKERDFLGAFELNDTNEMRLKNENSLILNRYIHKHLSHR